MSDRLEQALTKRVKQLERENDELKKQLKEVLQQNNLLMLELEDAYCTDVYYFGDGPEEV